jgi:hypothetical protein
MARLFTGGGQAGKAEVMTVSLQMKLKDLLSRALAKPSVHVACILLSGLFAYANTFNVPFLFDDSRAIVDNYLIKNLANLWPPSGTRWFGTLTFALNYAAGGLQVVGYHAVNLVIHLAAALLCYQLVALTCRTPFFVAHARQEPGGTACMPALAVALLFVAHPVQTQAVTYIVQRYASLATLLYFVAMVCYIQARLSYVNSAAAAPRRSMRTLAWYAAAMAGAVLAMKTKEIAFTLPVMITIHEIAFFPGRRLAERLKFLLPMALTIAIIPLSLAAVGANGLSVASSAADITRHDYLLTQFRVIVTYLRLLILPVNQMIDYVFPVSRQLAEPAVLLSGTLLVALFLGSVMLLISAGRGKVPPVLRLAGFGGLWFFITLSIESSIIPITDVIFEHRLYLPSAGMFMVFAAFAALVLERLGSRCPRSYGALVVVMAGILVALPVMAHLRNEVWRSELTLWEDAADKSALNVRARAIIAGKLIEIKKIDAAIVRLQEALRIKPDYADAIITLGNAYLEKGLLDEGQAQYVKALATGNMDFESRAMLMMNMGNYNLKKGFTDRAIYFYQNALAITPDVAAIHHNLGQAYKVKGLPDLAAQENARARRLNPDRY